jgi:hypothetical protein
VALAALLVALSGFIFGGGPEGLHGEAGADIVWWAAFIATLAAPVLGILLLRRGRPGRGVLIAWAPVIVCPRVRVDLVMPDSVPWFVGAAQPTDRYL